MPFTLSWSYLWAHFTDGKLKPKESHQMAAK